MWLILPLRRAHQSIGDWSALYASSIIERVLPSHCAISWTGVTKRTAPLTMDIGHTATSVENTRHGYPISNKEMCTRASQTVQCASFGSGLFFNYIKLALSAVVFFALSYKYRTVRTCCIHTSKGFFFWLQTSEHLATCLKRLRRLPMMPRRSSGTAPSPSQHCHLPSKFRLDQSTTHPEPCP